MDILTGHVTINAAFLQEIKEDDQELRHLMQQVASLLAARRSVHIDLARLAGLLRRLRDQLAIHFGLEESFGYFDDAVEVAPRLSRRAEQLRGDHRDLTRELDVVLALAEKALSHPSPGMTLQTLAAAFTAFEGRLRRHEEGEAELIIQAFVDDIGVGD